MKLKTHAEGGRDAAANRMLNHRARRWIASYDFAITCSGHGRTIKRNVAKRLIRLATAVAR